ncbi:GAF domain-containing protein [Streptomyces sp. ME02-8801-2C]|uniref:GAF domain-containing sensor histidine kinase n=1 Tax=Streptomyces sp. ME02-8801-2C TaxID=3028680 RepID=UPI0029B4F950|nr:GAF domain-containing protein [Streptomyces sp. ME02-8801-2C]MDX3454543.1 GAF domain-containing protein [Streptomyces sp. ME02-8801-2C]
MPDHRPLLELSEQYAELLVALDRGEALRRALALLADDAEVAWAARPGAGEALSIEQVVGQRTGILRALRVPPGTGLTGKVHRSGRAEWVDDYFGSVRITHTFDSHMATEGVRRLLAVPLLRDGESLGVLAVGPRRDGAFGDREIERASQVATQAALALSLAERARLTREIAVHEERRRLAAELHDSVGALLFAIGSGMANLADAASTDPELSARLDRLQGQAADATSALRESLRMLHSSPAALALGVALRADCAAFSDRAGVPAELIILDEEPAELPASRTEVLLAAVREALLNVEKHARASAVTVSVGRSGPLLTVAVHDDGVGLGPDHEPGLGLTKSAEALGRLGGTVRVVSDPDGGTIWRARLPC